MTQQSTDNDLFERVYKAIRRNDAKLTSDDLQRRFPKDDIYYAITRLTVRGRIIRKKAFGFGKYGVRVIYVYKTIILK